MLAVHETEVIPPHNARRSRGRATLQGGAKGPHPSKLRRPSWEGETFYAPWEQGGKLFILKKGRMRLYRTEGGREFTLEVVEAGTVFGEMAFTPYRLRESFARAIVPSVVFAMERAEVERLIEEKPQVGIRMISLLSERLHYYETRMEDITLREVPARLASLILFLIESEGVQIPGE